VGQRSAAHGKQDLKKPYFIPKGWPDISRGPAQRSPRKARIEKAVFHPEGMAGY